MIARITGTLEHLADDRAVVAAGAVAYEVMLAPVTADELRPRLGQKIALHTLEYFDGNPAYGQMVPRLVGFLAETDRRFFMRYVSVQGIGIAKGLKSLVLPVGQMARSIEARDASRLAQLPGVGRRTAEKIIAELYGKLEEFALGAAAETGREATAAEAEAVDVLVQLGLARPEASARVEAAVERLGVEAPVDRIIREAFHQGATPAEG